ncbi:MAG: hypothetical protein J6F30_14035 [Cellulosilyticum sp.]|nr:hypothetical protein [Cellulosilyticum sp.]
MYIQPNTTVRLLTGVPLDNTYAHTLYFANKSSQTSYFESKTKAGCLLSNLSYQRYTKGSLRIQKLADDIYDCNYMMFQNTAYGNKWFYAFINNIEYVSNTVCEITYEIDVIQTWFFDVTLLQSFVEREHSATDVAGDNIVPEPVNIGEYFRSQIHQTNYFDTYSCILVTPYKRIRNPGIIGGQYIWTNVSDQIPVPPLVIEHQMNSLFYTVVKSTIDMGQFLYELNDQGLAESIVSIYPVPNDFLTNYSSGDVLEGTQETKNYTYFESTPSTLGNYTPKNKKLLTYPYNKFVISTSDGNTREYAFEWFGNQGIRFNIYSNLMEHASFKAVPVSYKDRAFNYEESALLTDFPLTGYITDSFKAWLAQNKTRLATQVASSVLSGGIGDVVAGSQMLTPVTKQLSKKGAEMMSKGYEGMLKSGVHGITGTLTEIISHGINRYHAQGSADGSLEMAMQKKDFCGYQEYVNPNNARIIDDFFNCYGYATHRVKVPNRNVRPHWTYVKTIDINLESNAPSDDTNKIASIYDNGITFWRNPSEVGNYSLDNSPT